MSQFQTASQMFWTENLMEQTEGDVGMAMSMEMNEKMMKEIEEIKNAYETDMKEIFLNLGSSEFKCYMAVWKKSEKPLDMPDMKKQMLSLLEDHMDIVNQFEDGDIKDFDDWKCDLDFDYDDAESLIALRDNGDLINSDEVDEIVEDRLEEEREEMRVGVQQQQTEEEREEMREELKEELKEEWEKERAQKDKVIADLQYSLIHIGEMNKTKLEKKELKIFNLTSVIAGKNECWDMLDMEIASLKEEIAEHKRVAELNEGIRKGLRWKLKAEEQSVNRKEKQIAEMEKVCKCFRDIDGDDLSDLMKAYGWTTNDKGELIKISSMTMEDVFAETE